MKSKRDSKIFDRIIAFVSTLIFPKRLLDLVKPLENERMSSVNSCHKMIPEKANTG
jgi:hypothetical protein